MTAGASMVAPMGVAERFWSKVDKSGDCWVWTASKFESGYGQFKANYKNHRAHRLAYELAVGPVPEGIEPCTARENTMRCGYAPATVNLTKTHCPHGHPYSGDNLYNHPDGSRKCKTCMRAAQVTYRQRLRERTLAV